MRIHMLEDALLYAEIGFAVFPLQPRRKEPATKNGFKDATTDPNQIRLWWGEGKEYNIGIATGSGGRHLLYHSKNTESCRNRLYPGIDVRADGGYIVAPPSIHPNGQMYEWETDVSSGITEVDDLLKAFLHPTEESNRSMFQIEDRIPEGERNSTLHKLA